MLETHQILNELAARAQRAGELASRLSVSRATAHRKLSELASRGQIAREGAGPRARWHSLAQPEAWQARHSAVVSTPHGRAGIVYCGLLAREAALLCTALQAAQEAGRGHVHGLEVFLSPTRPGEDVAASNAAHAAVSRLLAAFKSQALGLDPSPQPGSRRIEADQGHEATPGQQGDMDGLLGSLLRVLRHAESGPYCADAELRAAAWAQFLPSSDPPSGDGLVLAALSARAATTCLAATQALHALESRDGSGLGLLARAGVLRCANGEVLQEVDCAAWAERLTAAARGPGCLPAAGHVPESRAALFGGLRAALSAAPCPGGPLPSAVAELLAAHAALQS